ncbi:putative proline dehydrogenase, mitochondrial [Golovinomyces cichoracearum]|uniref:Proline dehydrogenase n=1 Tax=Golovinomyces cichoracearum TaxID=62708 RepID=A0A420IX13_9PEZI|nr:putative proline dehydrogenase, mitochondrial [Golovinomyces cichoracearum]
MHFHSKFPVKAAFSASQSLAMIRGCVCYVRPQQRHQLMRSIANMSNESPSPLSILPLSTIIRSLVLMSITSSRFLVPTCLAITNFLSNTTSPIFSPDRNPALRAVIKSTLHRHFCAGETISEIKKSTAQLRSLGYDGVILAYAKELVPNEDGSQSVSPDETTDELIPDEIELWANGLLATIDLTIAGDFVAIKLTGAGSHVIELLTKQSPATPKIRDAIDSICRIATKRGVRLLFDAEHVAQQKGIDMWSLEWMAKYNREGRAVVYGTYQAYLKNTPQVLAHHLLAARDQRFTLGVKLVRGAYLHTDPRHLIHDTKEETDIAYDSIAESLVCREYGNFIPMIDGSNTTFPRVDIVLASHNKISLQKIQAIQIEQQSKGKACEDLVYAQLKGMADEVSCKFILSKALRLREGKKSVAKIYKYLVWGTVGESMKYLSRRAHENRDVIERTKEERNAMWREIIRRLRCFYFADDKAKKKC